MLGAEVDDIALGEVVEECRGHRHPGAMKTNEDQQGYVALFKFWTGATATRL